MAKLHHVARPSCTTTQGGNVLLFDDWMPKLTDFGIAKQEGAMTTLGTRS